MENIRNFCIIAHIDHGKSTLADRLIETTKTVAVRQMMNTVLDNMDLERERGITIKSHAIQMDFARNGKKYVMNLIDTPGHVDFSYEVSRSLAACEGALLLVDASQGIQAQTISNLYLALDQGLTIIPVINKIDMPGANPEAVEDQIVSLVDCKREDIIRASGRTGEGVDKIFDAIIDRIPAPKGNPDAPLRALIFDSMFNSFRGVIAYYRILDGSLKKNDKVRFFNTGASYSADEVGIPSLAMKPRDEVKTGDVGYLITGIKN
ncbi:MAG: GTP-binding protein, partial [Bacteroidetes bacterium]|nr:GTP-binding protein [Bacteroidota bacterium]